MLVGLSGSGKSLAGRALAQVLGTALTDVDEMIEREAGRTITRIFSTEGEAAFRERERRVMRQALADPPHVIVPGGGWAAQPGAMAGARSACTIYLRTSEAVAAKRLAGDHSRPLLGGDAEGRLAVLLAERVGYYESAEHTVETDDRSPDGVLAALLDLARAEAGWA